MIIYLDSNFCCHLDNDGTMRPIETDFFNGKCKTVIEGYRFIPEGDTWVDSAGNIWEGETMFSFINWSVLAAAQEQYESDLIQMQDMQSALEILGVGE